MVRHEASRLLTNFMLKSINTCKKVVLRFTKQMGLTHRAAMHTTQKDYHETMEESCHFIEMMRDKVADKDQALIINMDQTPIPFSFHATKTLEKKGMKTIHICSSTSDTKRVTLAATVDASCRQCSYSKVRRTDASHVSSRRTLVKDTTHARKKHGWTRK